MSLLRILVSLVLFAATYWSILVGVHQRTGRPVVVLLPIALGVLVIWETVLFNVLSLVHAVSALPVAAAHLALVFGLSRHTRSRQARTWRAIRVRLRQTPHATALLLVTLVLIAVIYLPTNWDSMTYHLARVAYWIQHRSIAYYPTVIPRQNVLTPGGEYLLLALQTIADSDRLANLIQAFSYLIVVLSMPALCRIGGLPHSLAGWAGVYVASLPIAILEATSTQNDLVAAVTTVGIVVAALPLFGSRKGIRHFLVLAVALSSGLIVKPTAVVAAAPFLLFGGAWRVVRCVRRREGLLDLLKGSAIVLVVCVVVLGPDLYRKTGDPGTELVAALVAYDAWGEWGDRIFNSLRGTCENGIGGATWCNAVARIGTILHQPAGPLYCENVYALEENVAGNPLHTAFNVLCVGSLMVTIHRLKRRAAIFAAATVGAWFLFHGIVRDQPFITRLQLPAFVLSPLLWPAVLSSDVRAPMWRMQILKGASLVCLLFCLEPLLRNQYRPFGLKAFSELKNSYYAQRPDVEALHNATLRTVAKSGCRRLGLNIGADDYDYPLTWRAMHRGVEVRHYLSPSTWPCLIFSPEGQPPNPATGEWKASSDNPSLYRFEPTR